GQQGDVAGQSKDQPGQDHQSCTDEEHPSPPQAIRDNGDGQRDKGVAQQSQAQERADLRVTQAQLRQIEAQNDSQKPISEQAYHPRRKQQTPINGQRLKRLDLGQLEQPEHSFGVGNAVRIVAQPHQ